MEDQSTSEKTATKPLYQSLLEALEPLVTRTVYPDTAFNITVQPEVVNGFYVDDTGHLIYPVCTIHQAYWAVYEACLKKFDRWQSETREDELIDLLREADVHFRGESLMSDAVELAYSTLLITPEGKLAFTNELYVRDMVEELTGRWPEGLTDYSTWFEQAIKYHAEDSESNPDPKQSMYVDPMNWVPILDKDCRRGDALVVYLRHFVVTDSEGVTFTDEAYKALAVACCNLQTNGAGDWNLHSGFNMPLSTAVRRFVYSQLPIPWIGDC